jgi:hypothetical protein
MTTWLTNLHAAKLDTRKAQEERLETARAFQRQTLLELQEAVNEMTRIAVEAYAHDAAHFHAGEAWGTVPRQENASDLYAAARTVGTLSQRVVNAALRLEVAKFTETLLKMVSAQSHESATTAREVVMSGFPALSMSTGECLRSYYEPT